MDKSKGTITGSDIDSTPLPESNAGYDGADMTELDSLKRGYTDATVKVEDDVFNTTMTEDEGFAGRPHGWER